MNFVDLIQSGVWCGKPYMTDTLSTNCKGSFVGGWVARGRWSVCGLCVLQQINDPPSGL